MSDPEKEQAILNLACVAMATRHSEVKRQHARAALRILEPDTGGSILDEPMPMTKYHYNGCLHGTWLALAKDIVGSDWREL